jgi:glycosidase
MSDSRWPSRPIVLEVNTLPWLRAAAEKHRVACDLAALPAAAWDELLLPGVDAVWLMGAWERSTLSREAALGHEGLMGDFRRALADLDANQDITGSAYAVRAYEASADVGGHEGLATARAALAERGAKLILDFVPNHVAIDHDWAASAPELLVRGNDDAVAGAPESFVRSGGSVFAHGRDPNFPPWRDTLQVNAFAPGARAAAVETLDGIAAQCDGVRCDMAMLLLSGIFEHTWGDLAGPRPEGEYWRDVIDGVRSAHPGFVFIAEAYWDTETTLQDLGFDFCYDKFLYDYLRTGDAHAVRNYIASPIEYQSRLLRFVENHDEVRAAVAFSTAAGRVAAVATFTLPGARMLYEGQCEGHRVRLPVFLNRAPREERDQECTTFYEALLAAAIHPAISGEFHVLDTHGWPDNQTHNNLAAWAWERNGHRLVVVVNLSGAQSQARVGFPWEGTAPSERQLRDLMSGETYWRATAELDEAGLFVDLGPWEYHVLDCGPEVYPAA